MKNKLKHFVKVFFISKILSVYRRIFVKNKIAFGEKNWYKIQLNYLCVDISESDLNINLERDTFIGKFNDIENIYTSHTLEHVTENKVDKFICESYEILKKGGVLRIEVPDSDLILDDYLGSKEYNSIIVKENQVNLVKKLGLPRIFEQDYIAFVGCISCYINQDESSGIHIPVTPTKEEFEYRLKNTKRTELYDWLISLQTDEQVKSHGHITWYNNEKLYNKLKKTGFKVVKSVKPGETISSFDLTLERPLDKRSKYSVIMEAIK
tara:strand:- start:30 stop:827 length:798 start_codon:yes stop_codon:yes gene_type:complete